MRFLLPALLALLSAAPPARADAVVQSPQGTQKLLARDLETVVFGKGSAVLTASQKTSLDQFARRMANDARLDKMIVAAWSDTRDPQAIGKKEVEADRKLAHARADAVKKALTADGIKNVSVYDVAETPNWFSAELGTPTANEAMMASIGEQLQQKGGAGTAVVVAKWKGEVATH